MFVNYGQKKFYNIGPSFPVRIYGRKKIYSIRPRFDTIKPSTLMCSYKMKLSVLYHISGSHKNSNFKCQKELFWTCNCNFHYVILLYCFGLIWEASVLVQKFIFCSFLISNNYKFHFYRQIKVLLPLFMPLLLLLVWRLPLQLVWLPLLLLLLFMLFM